MRKHCAVSIPGIRSAVCDGHFKSHSSVLWRSGFHWFSEQWPMLPYPPVTVRCSNSESSSLVFWCFFKVHIFFNGQITKTMKPHCISCKKAILPLDFPPADLYFPYCVQQFSWSCRLLLESSRSLMLSITGFSRASLYATSFCPQVSSVAQSCPTLCDPMVSLLAGTHIFSLILQGAKTVM